MRNDFTLDNKAVHLPNANTTGFGKYLCKRGDWLAVRDLNSGTAYGRSMGRVTFREPSLGAKRVGIYMLQLHGQLSSVAVRWINPQDVWVCTARMPTAVVTLLSLDMQDKAAIEAAINPYLSDKLEFGTQPWRKST